MARRIIILIICAILALLIASSLMYHEHETKPTPSPEPVYIMEYTRGVNILRRSK